MEQTRKSREVSMEIEMWAKVHKKESNFCRYSSCRLES